MTDKQKAFVDEYLCDLNATRAYKTVYKSCNKDETARVNASKLLTKANVKDYVDKRMEDRQIRTGITQDRVLTELAIIGFAKVTDYAEVKTDRISGIDVKIVDIKNTNELTPKQISAISSIKQGVNGIEVKLNDKMKALELLGRHLGMFNDKLEIKGDLGVKIVDDI